MHEKDLELGYEKCIYPRDKQMRKDPLLKRIYTNTTATLDGSKPDSNSEEDACYLIRAAELVSRRFAVATQLSNASFPLAVHENDSTISRSIWQRGAYERPLPGLVRRLLRFGAEAAMLN